MFEHVNVWHSTLAEACGKAAGGRLLVTLLSGPRDSRFSGRPPYVLIQADGDAMVRKYQVEAPEIGALLESIAPETQIWIKAGGGKDNQSLAAWTAEGAPIPQPGAAAAAATATAPATAPKSAAPSAPNGGAPPPAQATESAPPRREGRDTITADMWACLLEARRLRLSYEKEFGEVPTDAELRLTAALHIQLNMDGGRRALSRRPPTPADLRRGSDH